MIDRIHPMLRAAAPLLWGCLAAPVFGAAPAEQNPAVQAAETQQVLSAISGPMSAAAGLEPTPPGETWVERKNSKGETIYTHCTATQCDMPATCPAAGPPCLAQKKKEDLQKKEAPAQTSKSSDSPAAAATPGSVAGTAVDDILKNQPENSLLVPKNSATDALPSDWSGFDMALQRLGDVSTEAPAPGTGGTAIDDARRMRDQALKTPSPEQSTRHDPLYKNSPLFRSPD